MSTIVERILRALEGLPEPMQQQVLAFVERLAAGEEARAQEDAAWSDFSLSQAMSGMEREAPLYTEADLKEVFR